MMDDGYDEAAFSCRLDTTRDLVTLLSCLSHGTKKDQHAFCEVSNDGMTVIVTGRAKTTQAQGTMRADLCEEFFYQAVGEAEEDETCGGSENGGGGTALLFGLNLTSLLDCLQIFGPATLGQTALAMSYYPKKGCLKLSLEDGSDFTSCELRTLEKDSLDGGSGEFSALASAFRKKSECCRVILKSEHLKEAFQELVDLPGAATVTVCVSSEAPHFRLSSSGNSGSSEVQFPRTSEAFVHFECKVQRAEWTYQLAALESGMRALTFAAETYFRLNYDGIMCIQHQLPMKDGNFSFVDFLILADVEDNGD